MQTTETSGLAAQDAARADALKTIAMLRREASAEIERLIAFMDETDGYSTTELDEAADDIPCDDRELEMNLTGLQGQHLPSQFDDQYGDLEAEIDGQAFDEEPSLGSLTSNSLSQENWGGGAGSDLEESEGDDEPSVGYDAGSEAAELDNSDDEPSLGWTIDGATGNWDDRENPGHAPIKPKRRKAKGIRSERLFSSRKRLAGLSTDQEARLRPLVDRSQVSI